MSETARACPVNKRTVFPERTSQTRQVLSEEPVDMY